MRRHFNNKQLILAGLAALLMTSQIYAFTPQPGSPMAEGIHPRLHLTPDRIPDIQQTIAMDYFDAYQEYVNWAANMNDDDEYNILSEAGHDPLRAHMLHQAFIAAIGRVPGISYPLSLDQYARRAIDRLLERLRGGDQIAYVAPLTYDWLFDFMTESERQEVANLIVDRTITHKVFNHSIASPSIDPEQMFSSKYYECFYAWYAALAFWGDGYIDQQADQAVESFNDVMLNYGYLDAHNFVAGNSGGWSEWIGYSSWHPRTHILNIDAWRTATGENYIKENATVEGNAIKNYPFLMMYALDPHKYFNSHYSFLRTGSAETTDPAFTHRSMQEQMYVLPRILLDAGLEERAGLVRHIIENYDVGWPDYEHHYIWAFLGAYTMPVAYTPQDINLKKSSWTRNLGAFYARTGFGSPADGVFSVMDGHYRYDGHKGLDDFPGFALLKFGTLVNTRNVAHRGYGNLDAYPGGRQMNIVYFDGGHTTSGKSMDTPSELQAAISGESDYDWGGIEQVTTKEDRCYYVRVDRSRNFESGVHHSRDYIWLPGEDPWSDSDFLIVFDRTTAPSEPEWVYHVPWRPEGVQFDTEEDISTGSGENDRIGVAFEGSGVIIKELNGLGGERDNDGGTEDYTGGAGAHGVALVKSLLPKNVRVEISRVASFDSDVIKRQHHLAIKSHRWQVSVKPQSSSENQRFLNVFQTADANNVSAMTPTSLIDTGAMQGVWIQRENSSRPNYVALFHTSDVVNTNAFSYNVEGNGTTRHVITGLEAYTTYEIRNITSDSTAIRNKVTEPNIQKWDYKGIKELPTQGVLYFESELSGSHTFAIVKSGEQDSDPPSEPTGLNIRGKE